MRLRRACVCTTARRLPAGAARTRCVRVLCVRVCVCVLCVPGVRARTLGVARTANVVYARGQQRPNKSTVSTKISVFVVGPSLSPRGAGRGRSVDLPEDLRICAAHLSSLSLDGSSTPLVRRTQRSSAGAADRCRRRAQRTHRLWWTD